jgi:hypothetical protein
MHYLSIFTSLEKDNIRVLFGEKWAIPLLYWLRLKKHSSDLKVPSKPASIRYNDIKLSAHIILAKLTLKKFKIRAKKILTFVHF